MDLIRIAAPEGYDGVDVVLGKGIYTAPPLTLRAIRTLMPKISLLSDPTTSQEASFDILAEVIHATLKRNYPALTQEEVEEGLDIKNVGAAMEAILLASGLKRGNVQAVTEAVSP
jgi:hypothetical protein